eukprot:723431-Pyramimonas_sp.AAC.1
MQPLLQQRPMPHLPPPSRTLNTRVLGNNYTHATRTRPLKSGRSRPNTPCSVRSYFHRRNNWPTRCHMPGRYAATEFFRSHARLTPGLDTDTVRLTVKTLYTLALSSL